MNPVAQFIPGQVLNKHGKMVAEKPPENFKFKSSTGIWYESEEEYHRLLSEAK